MNSDVRVLLVEPDPKEARRLLEALATSTRPRLRTTWVESPGAAVPAEGSELPEVVLLSGDACALSDTVSCDCWQRPWHGVPLIALARDAAGAAALEDLENGPDEVLVREEADAATLRRALRYAVGLGSREAALRESRAQLRAVTDCAGVGMVVVSAEHRYLFANTAYTELLGLGTEPIVGKRVAEVLSDVYEEQIRPRLERAFTGERVAYELRRPPAPGQDFARCFAVTYEPQPSGMGPAQVMVVIYDVTERKSAEATLLIRECHSQALLRLSRRLERAESHRDILASVREALHEVLGFARVWLYQLSDDGEYLDLVLEEEGDTPLEQRGEGRHLRVAGDAMLEELVTSVEPVIVEDAQTDPRTNKAIVQALGNRTIVNIPIVLAGRTLGAFGTGSFGAEGVRRLDELERQFLAALGSHVAAVLDRVTAEAERRRAVEALRSSEVRFRLMAESLPQIVWTCEPDGSCDYLSRQWLEYTGVPAEVHVGFGWSNQIHPDDHERTVAAWRAAVESGGDYRVEYRLRRHDGTYRWFDTRAARIRDAGGHTLKWVGSNTDIEARKRAEDALKLFRMLVDRSNDAFEVIDPETGCFLDVSERGCTDLGYTREELLTMQVFDIDPTVDRVRWPAMIERLRQCKTLKVQGAHLRKDGTSFPVEVNVGWVELDRQYLVAVVRDITERVRADAALLERLELERQLSQLAATAPGAIYSFRLKSGSPGCFPYASQQLEDVLGFSSAALSEDASAAFARVYPDDLERLFATIEKSGRTGSTWTDVFRYEHPQKGLVWIEGRSTPVQTPDGELLWHGFLLDVTERKKLEEQFRQSQKMEAIGQLAGGVAHDFNNLLFVIFGYADLCLAQTPASDPRRGMLTEIRAAGERASGLTRQLLAFSRQQVLEPKVLSLNGVVSDVENMLRRLIGEDIVLTTELAPDLRSVKIDPGQIQQVVMNLAVNARDAMPQGGCLRIETRNVLLPASAEDGLTGASPQPAVMLTLSDTGTGMSARVRERIFEPFFSTKPTGKGTGLGLAVVHGIVTQSGGEIQVESEVGRGTEFRILLPAVDAPDPETAGAGATPPGRGSERILLVEDEDLVRRFAVRVLREFGYETLNAASGDEALRLAESLPDSIDLLITDVVMPGMNGRQIAEALTARYPQMKVLFLSGYTDDAIVRHGVRQAEVAFLQKPVAPDQLAAKVRELLDQR